MKARDNLITAVMIALSALTLTGMSFADQVPQANEAQAVGFDALAHDLFGSKQDTQLAVADCKE